MSRGRRKSEIGGRQDTRRWWQKKRWWILGFLAIFAAGVHFIPRFPIGPFTLYGDLTSQQLAEKIPYASLTSEQSYPMPEIYHRPWREPYITKFSNVRDCLVKNERNKEIPDLRLIDLNQFRDIDREDLKVCLWRIFTSLHDAENFKAWMAFHGFAGRITRRRSYDDKHDVVSINSRKDWDDLSPLSPRLGWAFLSTSSPALRRNFGR